ncbi:MAG: hypothetical protein Q8Q49_04710, partial [bacterium]|nr:hypothetical protein [bacterium]
AWLPENGDAVRHEPSVLAGGTAHFAALAASEMGHRYPKYRTIFEAWWPHAATAIAGTERRSLVQITDANGEQVTGENGEVKTNLVVEGLCVNSVVFNARKARDLIHRSYERFLGELSPLQTQGVLERDKPMKIGQPVSISVQTRQPELVGVS